MSSNVPLKDNLPIKEPLPELFLAIEAATKAGKIIMDIYNKDFQTSYKNDKEPLTEADIQSNELIQMIISKSIHPILSEESEDNKERLAKEIVWIIDPLDGTSDFIQKTGEFTVMISLVKKHVPIIGVIYWPVEDILFISQLGNGAYQFSAKHWDRLSVSKTLELENCSALGSRVHLSNNEKNILDSLKIKKFTSKGSSLKVAEISRGKAELYFTTTNKIKQWDTSASYCLINEAGGKMTDMYGNDLVYNTDDVYHQKGILVTNGLIHDQFVKVYDNFIKMNKNC